MTLRLFFGGLARSRDSIVFRILLDFRVSSAVQTRGENIVIDINMYFGTTPLRVSSRGHHWWVELFRLLLLALIASLILM